MDKDVDTFLFAHGWATDNWVWQESAQTTAEDKAYLNINLPGHGGLERWSEPTIAPAVKEIYRHIGKIQGKLIGIGWSLGAQALMASAAQFKGRFKALVLVGATPCFVSKDDFPYGQSRALVKRMIMDVKKDAALTLQRFYALNFTPAEAETIEAQKFVERYKYPGPIVCRKDAPDCHPAFRYDDITTALEALYNTDLREYLGLIDCPVLLVHGSKDTVCPVEAGRYLQKNLNDSRLEVFEGAGHAPFITEKARFEKTVKEFLKKI